MASPDILASMPKCRAPRPRTVKFCPHDMASSLDDVASNRKNKFHWDGTSYEALGRSLSPNVPSLVKHTPVLERITEKTKSGFPSFAELRSTLYILNDKYNIFSMETTNPALLKVCSDAAGNWRSIQRKTITTTHYN